MPFHIEEPSSLTSTFSSSISLKYYKLSYPNRMESTQALSYIHKGGSRSDITNYRPISLLNTVSKVLECIIYKKIIDFIQSHISKHQYGFLPNRSCLQQLLVSYHHIYSQADHGLNSDVIYLDFSKAFDHIPTLNCCTNSGILE